jgi:C4-dicarboxylate-specific signal transduction histidine kinase
MKDQATGLKKQVEVLDAIILPRTRWGAAAEFSDADAAKISSGARAILDSTKTLRRDLLASYRTEVPAVVCRVLSAMRERFEGYGIDRVFSSFEGDGLAQVDEEGLKTCLEILITNAAEAMEHSDRRELKLTTDSTGTNLLVKVMDSGSGLERGTWEQIFERDFSTKGPGRGLGLYHVRQTLAKYGGSVRVESSALDQGTVMTVSLRPAEAPSLSEDKGADKQEVKA